MTTLQEEQLKPEDSVENQGLTTESRSSSTRSLRISMDGSITPTSDDKAVQPDVKVDQEMGMAISTEPDPLPIAIDVNKEEPDASNGNTSPRCTKTRLIVAGFLTLVLIAVGVAVPLILQKPDESGILLIENYKSSHKVASVAENICYEWIPGQGKSGICSVEETAQRGGAMCNLVANSLLYSVRKSDIAIINAGVCKGDITAPELTVGDISQFVSSEALSIVAMSGAAIIRLLEDSLEGTFKADSSDGGAYPYAAGIRYEVVGNAKKGNRVKNVEIPFDLADIWVPINTGKFYRVITTSNLASGALGYDEFGDILDNWKTSVPFKLPDAFFTYAYKNSTWATLELEEYSTQSYISATKVGDVPASISSAGACNLVAWALMDQVLRAEMTILKASDCGSGEISSGIFSLDDVNTLIPNDQSLVTIKVSGIDILQLLEDAVDASIQGNSGSYPYSAALRFNVNAAASKGSRVSNIQTLNRSMRWVALQSDKAYVVLTTSDLASGNVQDYSAFKQGDASSIRPTSPPSAVETFLAYAQEWKVLYDFPQDKYSTQLYTS